MTNEHNLKQILSVLVHCLFRLLTLSLSDEVRLDAPQIIASFLHFKIATKVHGVNVFPLLGDLLTETQTQSSPRRQGKKKIYENVPIVFLEFF